MTEEGEDVVAERERRLALWHELKSTGTELHAPALLNERRIFYGGRGIWFHKEITQGLGGYAGVTVALLHTGSSYADDLSDDGVLYHYPQTKTLSRDRSEVDATKAAMQLQLPVFVVAHPTPHANTRRVHLGWVRAFDDNERWFLVGFGDKASPITPVSDEVPFVTIASKQKKRRMAKARQGQAQFKFQVFQRYGGRCAACDLAVQEMLEAAHIIPDEANGTNDPRNGIVFCANHHKAFDGHLLKIHPENLNFITAAEHSLDTLRVSRKGLAHLRHTPHLQALHWRWKKANQDEELEAGSGLL